MVKLQKPTNKLINKYFNKFEKDERYKKADDAIRNLFTAFPNNKSLEDILLKTSVVNDFYSTNILGTFKIAKHIQSLDIDSRIKNGDSQIVSEITYGHNIISKKSSKQLNFYSFATKYCNWHNHQDYPIYDSFVKKILMAYKRKDKFSEFIESDMKDFVKFKKIISDFKTFYKIDQSNLKIVDKFLWLYGKDFSQQKKKESEARKKNGL